MSSDWPLSVESIFNFIDFGLVRNSRDYSIDHAIGGTLSLQILIARCHKPDFVGMRVSLYDEFKKIIDVGPFAPEEILPQVPVGIFPIAWLHIDRQFEIVDPYSEAKAFNVWMVFERLIRSA
jgi:hypothetical protein